MTQKFFLKIDAESPDGEVVRCETQMKILCSSEMAISILVNFIKQDSNYKNLLAEALRISMNDDITIQDISDEEYAKHYKEKNEIDLKF